MAFNIQCLMVKNESSDKCEMALARLFVKIKSSPVIIHAVETDE
jgi:hypothetical protein